MPKYTDEELSMLTDEEREGLDESQDFDEGQDQPEDKDGADTADEKPIVVKDEDDDGDDDKAKPDADDGDDKAKDTAAESDDDPAKAKQDDPAADDTPAGEDDAPPARRPTALAQLPEDYDDQVAKIGTDKEALVGKFDEGDITMSEYHKELDALNRKERELERLKDRVEYEVRAAATHWRDVVVAGFLDKHPEYQDNQMLLGLLDQEVRKQQVANEDQFNPDYLTNAHKHISAGLPQVFKQAKAEAKPKREIPQVPSLANVPAADVDQPGDDKFAMLDRLADKDPVAYERALDKLSEAEREEYLAS